MHSLSGRSCSRVTSSRKRHLPASPAPRRTSRLAISAAALVTPLRHLPPLQQRLSIVLLLTLVVGSMALSWDHRKQFWFVLGMMAVPVAQPTARRTLSPAAAARARPR